MYWKQWSSIVAVAQEKEGIIYYDFSPVIVVQPEASRNTPVAEQGGFVAHCEEGEHTVGNGGHPCDDFSVSAVARIPSGVQGTNLTLLF